MAGVTAIVVRESAKELKELLRTEKQPRVKEKLQVLYWLKEQIVPTITEIATAIGKHRGTVQKWLALYRAGGLAALLEQRRPQGRTRVIPKWAEAALAKRLQQQAGFRSYGEVQQWLEDNLNITASYHAVYQMTRYRLKAKLKVARPRHHKQNPAHLEAFKKTLVTT